VVFTFRSALSLSRARGENPKLMDTDKEEFLKEFGADYGYPNGPKTIDEIRATEFKRLDGQNFPFYSRLERIQSCPLFGSHEMINFS
jgi:hypothetical protein